MAKQTEQPAHPIDLRQGLQARQQRAQAVEQAAERLLADLAAVPLEVWRAMSDPQRARLIAGDAAYQTAARLFAALQERFG